MFGFHFDQIVILAPLAELPFVGLLSVSELTFDEVIKILEVSIAIGIVHLLLAFSLRMRADWKAGNKLAVYTHDIPAIIQYLAVVSLILAAIGSQYDIIGMFLSDDYYDTPVPWLTFLFGDWVSVGLVAKAMPPVIIACIAITILGGMKEQKLAIAHRRRDSHGQDDRDACQHHQLLTAWHYASGAQRALGHRHQRVRKQRVACNTHRWQHRHHDDRGPDRLYPDYQVAPVRVVPEVVQV
jgi:hypothetical protein